MPSRACGLPLGARAASAHASAVLTVPPLASSARTVAVPPPRASIRSGTEPGAFARVTYGPLSPVPRARTAATRSRTGPVPSARQTSTVSPTRRRSNSSLTTIDRSSRSRGSPATTGSRASSAKAAGSVTARAPYFTTAASPSRTKTEVGPVGETTAPPGAATGLRAGPVTTYAAAVCSRPSAPFARVTLVAEPKSVPASATVTRTGAATAAVRRTEAALFSRTSVPTAPRSLSSRAAGRTRSGESRAMPVIRSIGRVVYVFRLSSADGSVAYVQTRRPRPARSSPVPSRARPRGRGSASTSASRSAAVGPTLPARRDAAIAPARATVTPVQNAAWKGQAGPPTVNHPGARPPSTRVRASSGAPAAPSAHPAAEARTPSAAASTRRRRRICPGVAPAVLSSPNSRRRRATAKAKVEATTKTETKAVTPPEVPRRALTPTRASASRSWPGSARRRSSPVRTWARSPTRARTSAAGASTPTASGPPEEVTVQRAPSSRSSSLSTGCGRSSRCATDPGPGPRRTSSVSRT